MLFKYGIKRIFHIYALFFNELFSIMYSKAAFMLTNREKKFLFKYYRKLKIFILPISIEDKFLVNNIYKYIHIIDEIKIEALYLRNYKE